MRKKEFKIGQLVYFVTDPEQIAFIVTGIIEREHGYVYLVSYGSNPEVEVYSMEISNEIDLNIKFSSN